MNNQKNVIAICGSTRAASINLSLLKAVRDMAKNRMTISIFDSIASLPHYNPDIDDVEPPGEVVKFRNLLRLADGIIISTPEYAMGVPGTLKNAIDWTVSSMEFNNKPVALITASSQGYKAHGALLETLHVIEARMNADAALVIPFAKTKISMHGTITDDVSFKKVNELLDIFHAMMMH